MRKTYRLLLLALVVAALACTALAEDPADPVPGTVTFSDNLGSADVMPEEGNTPKKFVSVTTNGTALAEGSQALLLMVQADATGDYAYDKQTPSEENIVYIDQAEVGAGGSVTFKNVYPSKMCNSVLLLGGGPKLEVLKEVRVELQPGDADESGDLGIMDFFMVYDGLAGVPGTFKNKAQFEAAARLDGEPGIGPIDFFTEFELAF